MSRQLTIMGFWALTILLLIAAVLLAYFPLWGLAMRGYAYLAYLIAVVLGSLAGTVLVKLWPGR